MIEDPTVLYVPVLVGGAFFMLFGVILGLVAANMLGSKERKQATGEKKVQQPDLIEVARLWREPNSGKLVVELDKQLFRLHSDLKEGLKDRLVQLVVDLRNWLGFSGAGVSQPDVVAKSAEIPAPPGVTPVSMNMVDIVTRVVTGSTARKESAPVPGTIAGQIGAILQEKLENSPLRNRGIRLVDLPGGGIQVVVGLERFESVADVTDLEIRTLLQACVAEWEEKFYPK